MKEPFNLKNRQIKKLLELLVSVDNTEDCKNLLLDLCSPAEIKSLADRWEVARLISDGKSYRNIAEKTKTSTATITRVGRSIKYGFGGYALALSNN